MHRLGHTLAFGPPPEASFTSGQHAVAARSEPRRSACLYLHVIVTASLISRIMRLPISQAAKRPQP